jgi:hypothetical protein
MFERRAVVGLSLLCALVSCAIAVPRASAKGTTAFTCVEKTGEEGFSDEHCDTAASGGSVKFVHKEIKPKLLTAITASNEKTTEETKGSAPVALRWMVALVSFEIVCTKVSGTGAVENKEVEKPMQTVGTLQLEYTGCTVTKPNKCKVKEPIIQNSNFTTYEAAEAEMGVELSPKEKGIFLSITLENNEGEQCSAKQTFPFSGNAQGTPGGSPNGSGATLAFTEGMGSLSIGVNPVTLISTTTLQTRAIFGLPEDPVTFTTTEK